MSLELPEVLQRIVGLRRFALKDVGLSFFALIQCNNFFVCMKLKLSYISFLRNCSLYENVVVHRLH
jgi:hypothetical protein